jgi:D-glycero-alpha-D-manno-heptose 1-phosphate guanylyltransferase
MQAVILVGGLGTRLRSALPDLPKPMAPIQGRPFLDYMLAQLKGFGVRDIVFCVGYKARIIEEYFGDGAGAGLNISYSHEEELLGTAGAVKLAEDKITEENFLLLNGDCYCDYDGAQFMAFHRKKNAAATILGVEVDDRSRFGSLKIE